jgi:glycosyltransferase involved in cell wall biosynthesis
MNIVQITPGAGDNFYCENCLRDISLVRAVQQQGHEIVMVPLYLPLHIDKAQSLNPAPVFYGGINVYLQQKLSFFRKTPAWIDRLFNAPKLLQWAGRKAGMTSAKDLGQTTLSMLQGQDGLQAKEFEKLMQWLESPENRPDVICLSNALLLGLAHPLKQRLGIPVVCLLQDEDGFLDDLIDPYKDQVWQTLIEKARDAHAFIAVSQFYGRLMKKRLSIPQEKMHVVPMGIPLADQDVDPNPPREPVLGFLSQMCWIKGLDTLIEAFMQLKQEKELTGLRLRIAGGKSSADESFVRTLQTQLQSRGYQGDVEWVGQFDQDARQAFLRSLTVLCVPEKRPVAYGRYVLEAWAAGVPVVQPASGVFEELLAKTEGGALYQGNTVESLVKALKPLLLDPEMARRLGRNGQRGVRDHYHVEQTARTLVHQYQQLA